MFYYQRMTPVVKTIIVVNIIVFLLQKISSVFVSNGFLELNFSIHYLSIVYEYKVWQLVTYMFLHGDFWHILFNMLALYFLGCEVEREWGSKHFLRFYLSTGVGAGLVIFALDSFLVFLNPDNISSLGYTLGASGAIFGLLLAYSLLYSERRVTLLLFFIIPVNMKAKNLLFFSLGISFLLPIIFGVNVSNSGHVGGVLSGIIYFLVYRKDQTYFYCLYMLNQWWQNSKNFLFPPKLKSFNKKFDSNGSGKHNRHSRHGDHFSHRQKLDETQMTEAEIESKIDELLDKISVSGLRGLSEEEKGFLERVSKLYRYKFPK